MVFKTVLEQSPSSNTPVSTRQLINRDFKTWSGSERELRENTMREE